MLLSTINQKNQGARVCHRSYNIVVLDKCDTCKCRTIQYGPKNIHVAREELFRNWIVLQRLRDMVEAHVGALWLADEHKPIRGPAPTIHNSCETPLSAAKQRGK